MALQVINEIILAGDNNRDRFCYRNERGWMRQGSSNSLAGKVGLKEEEEKGREGGRDKGKMGEKKGKEKKREEEY